MGKTASYASDESGDGTVVGKYILSKLREKGQTQTAFCAEAQQNRGVFSHILHGRRRIDVGWARVLAEHLGESPQYWLDLQRDEDLGVLKLPSDSSSHTIAAASVSGGVLCDQDIERLVASGELITDEFDEQRLRGASYDCRPGFVVSNERYFADLDPRNGYEVPASGAARLRTLEFFEIPMNVAANFGPTGELSKIGLSMEAGHHVHPGYAGHLTVTLRNHTSEPIRIFRDDRFLSVRFLALSGVALRRYSERELGPGRADEMDVAGPHDDHTAVEEEIRATIARLNALYVNLEKRRGRRS